MRSRRSGKRGAGGARLLIYQRCCFRAQSSEFEEGFSFGQVLLDCGWLSCGVAQPTKANSAIAMKSADFISKQ